MKYLLDTCVVIAVLNREPLHQNIESRIELLPRGSLLISALTAVEIWVGLARPRAPRAKHRRLETMLRLTRVLAFDEAAARQALSVCRYLEQTGQQIGRMDPLIAAQAMSVGAVCVTDNVRHFLRVPGLRVENWLRPE